MSYVAGPAPIGVVKIIPGDDAASIVAKINDAIFPNLVLEFDGLEHDGFKIVTVSRCHYLERMTTAETYDLTMRVARTIDYDEPPGLAAGNLAWAALELIKDQEPREAIALTRQLNDLAAKNAEDRRKKLDAERLERTEK